MATKANYQIPLVYKFNKFYNNHAEDTSYIFFVMFYKIENTIRQVLQITKYFTRIISMIIIVIFYMAIKISYAMKRNVYFEKYLVTKIL